MKLLLIGLSLASCYTLGQAYTNGERYPYKITPVLGFSGRPLFEPLAPSPP
jgi:hypothetical protein